MTSTRRIQGLLGAALAAVLPALVATGCVTDPVTGASSFSLTEWSPEEELELGRREAPNVESQFDAIYADAEANAALGAILADMVALSPRKDDFEFRLKILNSEIPNAMALPGGFVYVTRGLLGMLENQAEFVSVLGHELGHVEHRHAMLAQSRGGILALPTLPLDVLRHTLPVGKGVVGMASSIVGTPAALTSLRYSRKDELQADERGIYFAAELGFDPRDFKGLLAKFQALEKESERGGLSELSIFSTHPQNKDRIKGIDKVIAARYPELGDRPRESFAASAPAFEKVLSELREKAAAYEHHDEARRILYAEEDPRDPEVVAAVTRHMEAARKLVRDEPLFAILEGEVALLANDADRSVRAFLEAVQLYDRLAPGDGHWKAHLYLGLFALKSGETEVAIEQLERSEELFPLNPMVQGTLAEAYDRGGHPEKADAARSRHRSLLKG